MDNVIAFLKTVVGIAIVCWVILYLARPEMTLEPEAFVNILHNSGYSIYKDRVEGANKAYVAYGADKKLKVNYANFDNEKDAHNFYLKVMNSVEAKHSQDIVRDIRLGRATAEKQSFLDDKTYYIGIYAKNSVAYSVCERPYKDLIDGLYNKLYVPSSMNLMQIQSHVTEALESRKTEK